MGFGETVFKASSIATMGGTALDLIDLVYDFEKRTKDLTEKQCKEALDEYTIQAIQIANPELEGATNLNEVNGYYKNGKIIKNPAAKQQVAETPALWKGREFRTKRNGEILVWRIDGKDIQANDEEQEEWNARR